ncbi:TPA: hypothetical protein N0F65_002104 [Lagenidium giganteum]|uniref:Uncharacterized protein n=1 Tax=Lagenidium giganteum TaxID=4803 RepID=A0AAV2ZC59_9STRA|nr:TPA: hypothetical protein N0F65_002104 [Lagenidium giganteum]
MGALTLQQKQQVMSKKVDHPDRTRAQLVMWVKKECVLAFLPSESAISRVLRMKDQLQGDLPPDGKTRQLVRKCVVPELESKLWQWFKRRHNMRSFHLHGEGAGADDDAAKKSQESLLMVTDQYRPEDGSNMDETGLVWAKLPTHALSTAARPGRKQPKQRITVLVTANVAGTEKLPLLYIGVFQCPAATRRRLRVLQQQERVDEVASSTALFGSFLSFTACLFICIAFSFFPASIVVFLVKEKQPSHKSKHQQLVSGPRRSCPLLSYFFVFGLAICPFTYCLSYVFKEHASSQAYKIMINFVIREVRMVLSFILDTLESTKDIIKTLLFLWRLSPLLSRPWLAQPHIERNAFAGVGVACAVGINYALTFPRVKNMVSGARSVEDDLYEQDCDLEKETERVASGGADSDTVKLHGLREVYPGGKVAVRDLSFSTSSVASVLVSVASTAPARRRP